ncbi:MAG: transglycosylase SLT domain-containing protein [Alphaproteobacteria bacterium]
MPLAFLRTIALLLACLIASPALASPGAIEPRLAATADDAAVCGLLTRAAEKALGIPDHLLRAVGVVESGRYDRKLGRAEPWPWTINAEGTGATFKSKAAAIEKVEALRASGVRSIDVGCMQVNLAYHGDAFESLEEAFDPVTNIAYAAHFLTSLKEERGSWNAAVAAYHSSTPKFGIPYRQKVAKTWHGLRGTLVQDKIRQRRAAVAETYQKRKAEFEAHQARVLELQKEKREARRKERVEAVRGTTAQRGKVPSDEAAAEPLQTAAADQAEAASLAAASLRCEETTRAAGSRGPDPSLVRRIMAISASANPDDGFTLDGKDALEIPVARAAAEAASAEAGCPRLIEHGAKGRRGPAAPVVIRG